MCTGCDEWQIKFLTGAIKLHVFLTALLIFMQDAWFLMSVVRNWWLVVESFPTMCGCNFSVVVDASLYKSLCTSWEIKVTILFMYFYLPCVFSYFLKIRKSLSNEIIIEMFCIRKLTLERPVGHFWPQSSFSLIFCTLNACNSKLTYWHKGTQ